MSNPQLQARQRAEDLRHREELQAQNKRIEEKLDQIMRMLTPADVELKKTTAKRSTK